MKTKKGFTLVELLAVISILAILVIIALPNVLTLFENAKKNAFLREVSSVYSSAKAKYFTNYMSGSTGNQTYTNTVQGKELAIQNGTGDFKYYVVIDSKGNIIELKVSNGTYKYEKSGIVETPDISDVSKTDGEFNVAPLYLYSVNGSPGQTIGDTLVVNNVNVFDNYYETISRFRYPIFTAHKTNESNEITTSYIGFTLNNTPYYLQGGDSGAAYETNKGLLFEVFGRENCDESIAMNNINKDFLLKIIGIPKVKARTVIGVACSAFGFDVVADIDGHVYIKYDGSSCQVNINGYSSCSCK